MSDDEAELERKRSIPEILSDVTRLMKAADDLRKRAAEIERQRWRLEASLRRVRDTLEDSEKLMPAVASQ